ncbi:MAG TPA: D-amino-acid transaminase [Gemmatimonadaceae bacterium]
MFAYLNGQFLPRPAATISVEDRGFVFGDGIYEVWRVVNGRLFENDRHLARLAHGLRELRIAPAELAKESALTEIADRLLSESGLTEGEATFYVEITRGAAPRTHQFPATPVSPTVYATVNRFTPPEELRTRGAACITIPDIRWLRCDIKTLQLLPNVLAKQAAAERGALDAIMIRDGVVTETSHANVAAVIDGVIRTHPTNHLILPGVTRAVVLDIARSLDVPVSEEPVMAAELVDADEIFLMGTTTDVMPIVRLDDQPVRSGDPGPITTRLVREFRGYLDAACAAHATR